MCMLACSSYVVSANLVESAVWVLRILSCKQKTAYEMRISDWSSDVCSSDLLVDRADVEPISVYHGSTSSNDRKRPDFSDVLVKFLLRPCRALRPGVFLEIALRKEEAGAQRLAPRRILDAALLDVVEADPFHPGRGAVQIAGFLAVEDRTS